MHHQGHVELQFLHFYHKRQGVIILIIRVSCYIKTLKKDLFGLDMQLTNLKDLV